MHGHALMPDGRAMSKSRDIRVDPGEVIDDYGADPMRAFLLSLTARGEDMQFSYDETQEMQRRLNILWNVFRFPLPYMRMDGFDPDDVSVDDVDLAIEDRWVLSRLQTVEAEATEAMDEYRQDLAIDEVLEFVVGDVSRYYVRSSASACGRRKTANPSGPPTRPSTACSARSSRCSPLHPFVAEEIYGHLTGDGDHPTVHMCDWPEADATLRDDDLETRVEAVRAVEEAGSNARQQAERKLRWPVTRVVVDTDSLPVADAIAAHEGPRRRPPQRPLGRGARPRRILGRTRLLRRGGHVRPRARLRRRRRPRHAGRSTTPASTARTSTHWKPPSTRRSTTMSRSPTRWSNSAARHPTASPAPSSRPWTAPASSTSTPRSPRTSRARVRSRGRPPRPGDAQRDGTGYRGAHHARPLGRRRPRRRSRPRARRSDQRGGPRRRDRRRRGRSPQDLGRRGVEMEIAIVPVASAEASGWHGPSVARSPPPDFFSRR